MKKMFFGAMLFLGGLLGLIAIISLSVLKPHEYVTPNGDCLTGLLGFLLGAKVFLVFIFFITIFIIGFKIAYFEAYKRKED